jgi:hypothetical protein
LANFEVCVDDAAFLAVGTTPLFDENRYGDLLDACGVTDDPLVVSLSPHHEWTGRLSHKIKAIKERRLGYKVAGRYLESGVNVFCNEDLDDTNDTLLHETKHFVDDVTGAQEKFDVVNDRNEMIADGAILLGTVGTIALLAKTRKIPATIGAGVALPLLLAKNKICYGLAPDEAEARDFAFEVSLFEEYGRIITYAQAA